MSGPSTQPLVYFFGQGRADGTAAMKDVLGGKGAGLAEMTTIGIPVPPGFTIASSLCLSYLDSHQFPKRLQVQVENALHRVEAATGKHFGDGDKPLLVSVRSGAAVSMPGMMETILNLGLNDVTVEGLTRQSRTRSSRGTRTVGSSRCTAASCSTCRASRSSRSSRSTASAAASSATSTSRSRRCRRSCAGSRSTSAAETGREFPSDPMDQLWGAIAAVFESWNTRRAIDYRKLHDIPDSMGTAVNVVAMVFGNLGEDSGTGVAFSRDPSTGERALYGEYLLNAQGEDVVSGSRTPLPIATLKDRCPASFQELERVARTLERHFRDVQDMEFTIERGTLYMLQTRRGQRSGHAAVRIACEMVDEELISEEEAVARIPPHDLNQLLHPTIDPNSQLDLLTTGLPASPGAACGTHRVRRRSGRAAGPRRSGGHPGAAGDVARGLPRHGDGQGRAHRARRHDLARGGGGARHGQAVRGRRAGRWRWTSGRGTCAVNGRKLAEGDWITVDGSTGQGVRRARRRSARPSWAATSSG